MVARRCDLNMTQCEDYDTIMIRDICNVLSLSNQMWTDFAQHTTPKAKCPFDMKSIMVTNATVDLGYVAYLPLDGFYWSFLFKVFKSILRVRNKKKLLFCGSYEAIITKTHQKKSLNLISIKLD